MKIQIKLVMLVMTVTVIFITALIIFKITETGKIKSLLENEKIDQAELTEKAIEIISKSTETFVYDYSFWDEMVAFTKTKDMKWAAINIDAALPTFKSDVMWVYNTELNLIYSKSLANIRELKEIPASKETIHKILKDKYFMHFYAPFDGQIIEIFCAPIQPSADLVRKTIPQGYLFAGRIINNNYLSQLSLLSSSTAQLIKAPFGNEPGNDKSRYSIRIEKILYGINNVPVAKLFTNREYNIYESITKTADKQFFVLIMFSIVILITIAGSIYYIITRPLNSISRSLLESNSSTLENLQSKPDEFGQIASLIINFFTQKNLLKKEINDRIKIEEELQKTKADLEVLVEQRTRQLTQVNKELQEDIALRKKIEEEILIEKESSRLKSTLLLNLNHEFRTPLTGILGSAAILKEVLSNVPEGMFVDGIISSGNRLLRTFNSFLALSELELGHKEIKGSVIHLNQLISQIVDKMGHEAAVKGIGMRLVSINELFIPADEYFLKLTIINILDNAIKFTNKGEIVITLRNQLVDGQVMGKLEIADTGIGISGDHINFIFHEFRQVSEGIGRRFEGNGLGLTIAKKIILRLGGTITVKSEVNKGSVFTIMLPLISNDFYQEGTVTSGEFDYFESTTDSRELHKNVREVLLVEDNFINAEVIANFLAGEYSLDHAYTGASAIEMAEMKNYDIILMDINLGEGLDGVETCAEIRKMGKYKNAPIIAVTGYSFLEEKEKLLASGLTEYISKPFEKKELIDMMNRFI